MDDLSSLDWATSKAPTSPNGLEQGPKGNYYPALRPTPPLSGRSTPASLVANGTGQKPLSSGPSGTKGSTPANDSFANLVSFNASQSTKNLSLQEQQRVLHEQKTKQEEERRRQFDSHFGVTRATSGSLQVTGNATPNRLLSPPTYNATDEYGGHKLSKLINKPFAGIPKPRAEATSRTATEDVEDLLAAFNSSAPVDTSSHMPAVVDNNENVGGSADKSNEVPNTLTRSKEYPAKTTPAADDDDDPFGLGPALPSAHSGTKVDGSTQHDDDVLGLLSRPVSEFPKPGPTAAVGPEIPTPAPSDSLDRAVAEIVDMGFSPERSKLALGSTDSGMDIQAAVGWLLSQAHEDSRKEKQRQDRRRRDSNGEQHMRSLPARRKSSGSGGSRPAWMKQEGRNGSSRQRHDSKLPAKGEKDPAQLASELGNNIFKTANSLWKTGTKKINQAVADLNADSSSDRPKWMREAQAEVSSRNTSVDQPEYGAHVHDTINTGDFPNMRSPPPTPHPSATDEALLLEPGNARSRRKHTAHAKADARPINQDQSRMTRQPRLATSRDPASQQPSVLEQNQTQAPRARLNRQTVEEEAAQAYISPARRKRPTPPSASTESEPDLLSVASAAPASPSAPDPRSRKLTPSMSRSPATNKLPPKPPPPKRIFPQVSSSAIQKSTLARQAGTEAFKRGDYAEATNQYSTSLSALPSTHPITIIILTNRALSHLKTGDPKACIADAKATVDFIGPSRGVGETIELGGGEGVKFMDLYWSKAMMRQAEAFEQLERWSDAGASWRACVEAGVGGATSIAGRNRCESTAKPKPATYPKKPPVGPTLRPSALNALRPNSGQSAEAVTRLRAANAAADKLDDEKFALADQVDARVMKWRTGKEGNLRALLSSLETVLWEDAGWKKVGMGDVLLPGKVKIVYMKGIAKVHPDKVCAR